MHYWKTSYHLINFGNCYALIIIENNLKKNQWKFEDLIHYLY